MSASDVIAVVLAVVVAILSGAVVTVLLGLRKALKELNRSIVALRNETLPLVDELRDAVDSTVYNVDRVDRLITAAEGIEAHVDSASRLAYRTISSPVVKTMAFGSGVKRSMQRLRRSPLRAVSSKSPDRSPDRSKRRSA
jgi:hypothetical protein